MHQYVKEVASIVGVCLIRNEEYFTTWALMNVMEFCDHILVMDNYSDDLTGEILRIISKNYPHVETIQVRDPNDTHDLLEGYFGTNTWMLKIDGDEIYDPQGLSKFRTELLASGGKYNQQRGIGSMMVHVADIDFSNSRFSGYVIGGDRPQNGFILNCNAVKRWVGKAERMHAKNPVWHPEFESGLWHVGENCDWKASDFRCLHMCFWPRSSLDRQSDKFNKYTSRWNPREAERQETMFRRFRRMVLPRYAARIDHKNRWYRNDNLQVFDDLAAFGRPDDYPSFSPKSDEIVSLIESISKRREQSIS